MAAVLHCFTGAFFLPQFKVNGVDRETKLDTELVVFADSPENAKVKGQLQGMVVTAVAKLDAPQLPAVRQSHAAVAAATAAESAPQHVTIIHQAPTPQQWNRGAAIVMSFLIPGLGQMYKGQIWRGLLWFIFTSLGYAAFVVPGLILHLLCLFSAAGRDPAQVAWKGGRIWA